MTDLYHFIFFNWLELLIAWFSISLVVAIHFCAAVRYGEEETEEYGWLLVEEE